jgi:type IV pilus assembly protein PilM
LVGSVGDRRILAVDWDSRELRVVHARIRKERVHIEDVFAVAIPGEVAAGDAEAMGRLLRHALDQERITCRRVIVDIPRDQAVLNTLSLPPASVSDMAGMVQLRLGKSLPFPTSEAVIDFTLPPDGDRLEGPQEVLAAAVQREVVEFYRQVCANAGLRLERIGLRPYATKVAVGAFLGAGLPERVLVVDIGPVLTEIDVLRGGKLVFSRAASVYVPPDSTAPLPMTPPEPSRAGGPEKADGEGEVTVVPFAAQESDPGPREVTAVVADLMVEVTRSIEAYRASDPGAEMDCAVVAGATGIEDTLADAIHRRFGINCETYNPSAWFDGDAERGAAACGFSASLGLVLGHAVEGARHFDFLHPKKQAAPGEAKLRKAPMVAAVVALFAVAGIVYYWQGPAKQFAQRRQLEEQIAQVRAEIKENEDFMQMVEAAQAFEQEQVVWLDELNNLVALLPDNRKVVLSKLDLYQDDRRMQMDFRASDSVEGARMIEQLEAFRLEGQEHEHYQAKIGPTSEKRGKEYPHEGGISIQVVGFEGGSNRAGGQ